MDIIFSIRPREYTANNREGKGKSIICFPKDYCVVDIETTGLSPQWDSIIELGAIRYSDGKEIERFQTLVKPPVVSDNGIYIDGFIEQLTGITNEMLSNAPDTEESIAAFNNFLGDDIVIGYHFSFDANFLHECYLDYLKKPFSNNYVDVLRLARKLYPEMPHHRLSDMVGVYGLNYENAHRSLSDILMTEECFEHIYREVMERYGNEDSFINQFKKKYSKSVSAKDIIVDETKGNPDSLLYHQYCVFTGKLEKFSRKEVMQLVANLGGFVEDSVTAKTNYLILGNNDYCASIKNGKSRKQLKAEENKLAGQNIEILPESVFYDVIKEDL